MLKMEWIRSGHRHEERIAALYERAFPENERRPLRPLMDDATGVVLYDDGAFVRFADIHHFIYFAVEESLRGQGYGAQMLERSHCAEEG